MPDFFDMPVIIGKGLRCSAVLLSSFEMVFCRGSVLVLFKNSIIINKLKLIKIELIIEHGV